MGENFLERCQSFEELVAGRVVRSGQDSKDTLSQ
jgi:hypothetical protein